jgi:hypothetical protein
MANTPKEKFKDHSRFCALVVFSILSSAPLLSTNTERDEETPVIRSSKLASYIPENLLEKAKKVALFIADESDAAECLQVPNQEPAIDLNDAPLQDTSRALVVASPGFNFSIPNPFSSLTKYMKEVDWRKAALLILDEEEVLSKEDSDTKKPSTSSDEDESEGSAEKSEKDEGDSFRTAIPSTESVDIHSPQEGGANNGEEDEHSSSHSHKQSEIRNDLSPNEDIREDPDLVNDVDKSLLEGGSDSSSNVSGDQVQEGDDGSSIRGDQVQEEGDGSSLHGDQVQEDGDGSSVRGDQVQEGDDGSFIRGDQVQEDGDGSSVRGDQVQEGDDGSFIRGDQVQEDGDGSSVRGDQVQEDSEVNVDDDSSFLKRRPVENTDTQTIPALTLLSLDVDQEVEAGDTSSYHKPKKKREVPVTPKAKIKAPVMQVTPKAKIKAPVTPKTPEQAGFNVKTQTDIGPIYHGLTYSYKNPKGEPKMLPGSRLAHFVEKSPHPKKFVLIEAQSPSKTKRSTPFVIKFNKGVAPDAVEESSSESDSNHSEEGSSDESDSSGNEERSSDESK